jgi:WD40 repeat protein/serine/threonine protein kinase
MTSSLPPDDLDALLGQVIDEFLDRVRRGERPEIEDYASRHPRIADLLRQGIPALALVNDSTADRAPRFDGDREPELSRQRLGDFQIIRELGRGGMGIVYEAEQVSMSRRVALKILPFAALADDRRLKRFQNEVRAAATLDHPHIVSVYAVGHDAGIHYYAMQLIHGQSLAALIGQLRQMMQRTDWELNGRSICAAATELNEADAPATPLPTVASAGAGYSEAVNRMPGLNGSPSGSGSSARSQYFRSVARLGIEAAQALEHAHEQGIIHRDIKPGNLLLSESGTLYVTDFGVARIGSDPGISVSAEVLGTLRYMGPEQALARGVVDHRADIYSLGATLYELLALRPVFEGDDRQELLRQIAFDEPTPLRRLDRSIPRDLETIVRKSLAKEVQERYASVGDLREDLERFLDKRPINARPIGATVRTLKLAGRYPVAASLLSLSVVLLCVLAAGGWWSAVTVRESLNTTRDLLYAADVRLASQAVEAGDLARARSLLRRHAPDVGEEDRRGFPWHYLNSRVEQGELILDTTRYGEPTWIDCSPDGRLLASGHSTGEVILWSTQTWAPTALMRKHQDRIWQTYFSRDGSLLASGSDDGTVVVWDVASRRPIATLPTGGAPVRALVFSPDGQTIAAAAKNEVHLWRWAEKGQAKSLREHEEDIQAIAFSPDGKWLISVDGWRLLVWDWRTGEVIHRHLDDNPGILTSVAFTPDGRRIAVGNQRGRIHWFDTQPWQWQSSVSLHTSNICSLQFSADGQTLLSASKDMTVRLTKLENMTQPVTVYQHDRRTHCARFLPRDGRVVSASRDKTIRVWPLVKSGYEAQTVISGHGVLTGILSPDARTVVATAGGVRPVTKSTSSGERHVLPFVSSTHHQAVSQDGRWLVTAAERVATSEAMLRDPRDAVQQDDFDGDGDRDLVGSLGMWGRVIQQERAPNGLGRPRLAPSTSHDGHNRGQFVWSNRQQRMELWKGLETGLLVCHPYDVAPPAANPSRLGGLAIPTAVWPHDLNGDGELDLVMGTRHREETIAWYESLGNKEFGPQQVIARDLGIPSAIVAADLNEDELPDVIAATEKGGICWMKNLGNGQFAPPLILDGENREAAVLDALDVDADGLHDVVAATEKGVWWFRRTGPGAFESTPRILETLEGASWLRKLPSGIVLWDTQQKRMVSHFSGHTEGNWAVALSPSGERLATAGSDDVVRIWELPSGDFVRSLPRAQGTIEELLWSDDHTLLVAAGDAVDVWDVVRIRIKYQWTKHENTVSGLALSPASPLVATLSHDNTVRLWSLETGAERAVLTGHTQRPVAGAFSQDGRTLVTAGELGSIRVWDVATAQELLTLTDFTVENISSVGFRDPQTLIAVGKRGGEVCVGTWQVSSD